MTLNWKALAPHRPLDPGEAGYVAPPSGYAERIARLVTTGTSTVLVGGPVGVGKSTELARVASALQSSHLACLVHFDRLENIRRLTAEQMLVRLAGKLVEFAHAALNIRPSPALVSALHAAGVAPANLLQGHPATAPAFTGSPISLVHAARDELARRAGPRRLALLLDGLEKMPEGPQSSEVLATLGQLGDAIDIVAVVPWFVAFGGSEDVVRPGALFAPVPVPEVDETGDSGRLFLVDVLARRLGLAREALLADEIGLTMRASPLQAARWSGGLPRTFLQLMADAAQYALLRRGEDWPRDVDLIDAINDQRDSFRRALLPGDTDAILRVRGTDGREMELGRKIRLLARGVILERQRKYGYEMDVHPLARKLLVGANHA